MYDHAVFILNSKPTVVRKWKGNPNELVEETVTWSCECGRSIAGVYTGLQ